jgi:hypothetical protein
MGTLAMRKSAMSLDSLRAVISFGAEDDTAIPPVVESKPMVHIYGVTEGPVHEALVAVLAETNASVETVALDQHNLKKAALDLFVFTPKQTGAVHLVNAALTAAKSPDTTAILFLDKDGDDEFNDEDKSDVEKVKESLNNTGAQIFGNLDEVKAYAAKALSLPEPAAVSE